MRKLIGRLIGKGKSSLGDFELFFGGNHSAPNVLIFTEYVNATYFISFDIPLRSLHATGKVNVAVASQKHVELNGDRCWEAWNNEFQPDLVVMTRYSQADGKKILDYFSECGIPVIYHIDDDLLDIPESLGTEIQLRNGAGDVIDRRTYLLKNCDLIYASTSHLSDLMQRRFPSQRVFSGIYAPYMGELIKPFQIMPRITHTIGYMGSKGHQHDLELVVPALERLLDERKNLEFEVFGTIKMPKALERFGSRVRSRSVQKSYIEFLVTLAELGWDIGIAPLVDAPFNQCKAPTKFIEYTACGIPVVASNISVYKEAIPKNGGLLTKQDWYTSILEFLDNPQKRLSAVKVSQLHCKSKYSQEVLQQQLVKLFQTI
jgi:glycosyltransferase involved in cell wall biosynthesis